MMLKLGIKAETKTIETLYFEDINYYFIVMTFQKKNFNSKLNVPNGDMNRFYGFECIL